MNTNEPPPPPLRSIRKCEGCEMDFLAVEGDERKRCPACTPKPLDIAALIEAEYQKELE